MSDYVRKLANEAIGSVLSNEKAESLAVELLVQLDQKAALEVEIEELKKQVHDTRTEIAVRLMAGMLARGKTDAKYALKKADELLAEVQS